MTKKEYLKRLSTVLQAYDEDTRNEIIHDYEEHFRLGFEEGKSEEEIIDSLGGIDDLVALLEDSALPKASEHQTKASQKKTNHVIVHGYTADVYVKPSLDSKINAHYVNHGSTKEKLMYSFTGNQEDDTFVLRLDQRDRLMNFFSFGNQPRMEIFLEIPAGLDSLTIKTLSGDIQIRDIEIKDLAINTASGDISCDQVSSLHISGNSASGDIDITNCTATLTMNTASGDVSVDQHEGKSVKMTTASGDIEYHGACDVIECKSASGDCDLALARDCKVTVSVVSGDTKIRLRNDTARIASLAFSTVSGDIHCTHPSYVFKGKSIQFDTSNPGTAIRVHSVSGDVQIH